MFHRPRPNLLSALGQLRLPLVVDIFWRGYVRRDELRCDPRAFSSDPSFGSSGIYLFVSGVASPYVLPGRPLQVNLHSHPIYIGIAPAQTNAERAGQGHGFVTELRILRSLPHGHDVWVAAGTLRAPGLRYVSDSLLADVENALIHRLDPAANVRGTHSYRGRSLVIRNFGNFYPLPSVVHQVRITPEASAVAGILQGGLRY
jgi:hypothetical protein